MQPVPGALQFTPLSYDEEDAAELQQQKELKEAYSDNLKAGLRQLIAKDVAAKKLRKRMSSRQQQQSGHSENKTAE